MTAPRRLTETEKAEIRLLKTQGVRTKELALKFRVHERTIERVVAGRPDRSKEYEKANAKVAKKLNPRKFWNSEASKPKKPDFSVPTPDRKRSAPKLPDLKKVARGTEVIPRMRAYQRHVIQTGAVLVFRKDGTLYRVEGCPIYGKRHSSWLYGTVDVLHVQDGRIFAVVRQWDGEDIKGELVFDGNNKNIKNCYFYAEKLPEKTAKRDAEIRERYGV